jgi:hypothetical protein
LSVLLHCYSGKGVGKLQGMSSIAPTWKNHGYLIEIVAGVVWLYFRFNASALCGLFLLQTKIR